MVCVPKFGETVQQLQGQATRRTPPDAFQLRGQTLEARVHLRSGSRSEETRQSNQKKQPHANPLPLLHNEDDDYRAGPWQAVHRLRRLGERYVARGSSRQFPARRGSQSSSWRTEPHKRARQLPSTITIQPIVVREVASNFLSVRTLPSCLCKSRINSDL